LQQQQRTFKEIKIKLVIKMLEQKTKSVDPNEEAMIEANC